MIAIKRLQNILWILVVAMGALSAYLISLRVATERNAVHALDQRIYRVRGDIRYLETEFEARANMRQLEQWNAKDYRYVAPEQAQYLPDERALASLDRVKPNGDLYVAPPVMMAMVDSDADLPAAAAARAASPAPAQIRAGDTILRAARASVAEQAPAPAPAPAVVAAPVRVAAAAPPAPKVKAAAKSVPAKAPAVAKLAAIMPTPRPAPTPDPVARKVARMALLDAKLLDDRTLRDLGAQAAAETGKGRR